MREYRKLYENYMKRVTDSFVAMQSDIHTDIGHDRDVGFMSVTWTGGLDYKIELNGSLYMKGVTKEEMEEKISLYR